MGDSNDIYAIIEQRRRELGLSQAQVSERAFSRSDTSAIQNIRRGSSPSVEKLAALGRALGLEFYFGPKRPSAIAAAQAISKHFEPALSASREALAAHGFADEPVHFQAKTSAGVVNLNADIPGWSEPVQTDLQYPLPEGADDQTADYVQLIGGECAARGVPPDAALLIDRTEAAGIGDVALLTDREGRQMVRRITQEVGEWLTTTGYHFDGTAWTSFTDTWKNSAIADRAKVVAAFEHTPSPELAQMNLLAEQPKGSADLPIPIGHTKSGRPVLFASPRWLDGNADVLDVVTVPDDAMVPLLRKGATVVIRTDAPLSAGMIVATLRKGKLGLHRFRQDSDGGMFLWHDNPSHTPISVPAGSTEYHIMGCAIWAGFWVE